MRKMITALVVLLLAATSAQGAYILSLEEHTGRVGGTLADPLPFGTYTVDLNLVSDGQPSVSFGETTFMGAQTMLAPLPAGWSVSGLTYNTVDFDSAQIVPGSSLAGLLGIAADLNAIGGVGYTSKKTLLSFTLFAPTFGELALSTADTSVVDGQFNTVYVGEGDVATVVGPIIGPEPGSVLLLIAALPLLRRRRA